MTDKYHAIVRIIVSALEVLVPKHHCSCEEMQKRKWFTTTMGLWPSRPYPEWIIKNKHRDLRLSKADCPTHPSPQIPQLLVFLRIDDVVDASPVHFFCGMWGTIAAGLFAEPDNVEMAYGTGSCGLFYKVSNLQDALIAPSLIQLIAPS